MLRVRPYRGWSRSSVARTPGIYCELRCRGHLGAASTLRLIAGLPTLKRSSFRCVPHRLTDLRVEAVLFAIKSFACVASR